MRREVLSKNCAKSRVFLGKQLLQHKYQKVTFIRKYKDDKFKQKWQF